MPLPLPTLRACALPPCLLPVRASSTDPENPAPNSFNVHLRSGGAKLPWM